MYNTETCTHKFYNLSTRIVHVVRIGSTTPMNTLISPLHAGAPVQFPQATSSGPHSIKVEWSVDQRVLFYPVVTGYLVNVTDQHTNTHVKNITVPSQNSTVHYSHVVSSLQPSTEYSITICAVMESGDHGPTNSTIERTGENHSQN